MSINGSALSQGILTLPADVVVTDSNGNFLGLNSAMMYANSFTTSVTTANQIITSGIALAYNNAGSSITSNTIANFKFNLVNVGSYMIDFVGQVIAGASSQISIYPAVTTGGTSTQPIGGSTAMTINSAGNSVSFHARSIVIVMAGIVVVQPEITQSAAVSSVFNALTYTITKVA